MEEVLLENSEVRLRVHDSASCRAVVCAIHNRTGHTMRAWPQHWRGDRRIMERICKCGVGHPDPDDPRIRNGADSGDHGCCGCCHKAT